MTDFKVIGEKLLVQRDAEKEDGHVLMPNALKKAPKSGVVLTVGTSVSEIKPGDHVFFNEYAGYFLEETSDLTESDLIVMDESEVLAYRPAPSESDEQVQ